MAIAEAPVLAQLLGLRPPWTVQAVQPAADTRVLTVRVGRHRPAPLFSLWRQVPPPLRYCRWEHLPVLGQRCQVVLALAPDDFVPEAPWTGESGQPFSRALARQVIDLLLAGATVEQLCVLLRLPVADLWRFKFRLDGGRAASTPLPVNATANVPAPESASRPAPPMALAVPAAESAEAADGVPAAASPLWMALLMGRVALEVRALSLRLLLSKLQREAALHRDPDLHAQAATELQRYVQRNRAMLGHELAQLRMLSRGPVAGAVWAGGSAGMAAPDGGLPAATDPLWMELLQGQRTLEVRALGLKLLLSRLRGQIDRVHDDEARMVKLVELHRYFERNQATLGHELAQIGHWHAH